MERTEAIHKSVTLKLDKLDKELREYVNYLTFYRLRDKAAKMVTALRQDLFEFREQVAPRERKRAEL